MRASFSTSTPFTGFVGVFPTVTVGEFAMFKLPLVTVTAGVLTTLTLGVLMTLTLWVAGACGAAACLSPWPWAAQVPPVMTRVDIAANVLTAFMRLLIVLFIVYSFFSSFVC
jgi:hypothetical protein